MTTQYQKNKSVAKITLAKGSELDEIVLDTMNKIARIVGSTLGPGGSQVLIERQEENLPPLVTKDGVTVHSHLGFDSSIAQVVLESARSAAVQTANDAGDGTSTASILSEAIVFEMQKFCREHPKFSRQKAIRLLESIFRDTIEPTIKQLATQVDFSTSEGKKLLHSVAKISANGDVSLADAVMKCFELVGDEGNVTLVEASGHSAYDVERIEGFPIIGSGWEESCRRFYNMYLNQPEQQRCWLDKPMFILYNGAINDIQTLFTLAPKLADAADQGNASWNIVLAATSFSETVLGHLGANFKTAGSLNVVPLIVPKSPLPTGQLEFLEDLAAITDTVVFDPISRPLQVAEVEDLGRATAFEMNRTRSMVMGFANEQRIIDRVKKINSSPPEGLLEKAITEERVGKLTGGIARLIIKGSSSGETREKRDRAEDAVCAVRGAIKHGCLPGGGWTLLKLCKMLYNPNPSNDKEQFTNDVLVKALKAPVNVLLDNCGLDEEEKNLAMEKVLAYMDTPNIVVFDALDLCHVNPFDKGILDSTPAVLEAIRNSLSIAGLLGTLGGTVVFPRDHELETINGRALENFKRGLEEADSESEVYKMSPG